MASRILVVDDEKLIRWSIAERLKQEGHQCREAENGAKAIALCDKADFDLMMLDLRLPDMTGLDVFAAVHEAHPDLPVIIITAYSTVDGAVEAMKQGVRDYVSKPFNMEELVLTVRNVLASTYLERRVDAQTQREAGRFGLSNIVGDSPAISKIKHLVMKIAGSEATTVLLLGESGTGKDMVARAIHYESSRIGMPFMNVTCTALPESLLDSELFGYEKGAFTDAKERKRGLFELSDGGTVFLDEIGDMTPALQSKLLRVLEEKAFRRIGGGEDISVDVRVIAATNRDLEEAIRNGTFREDLYYRLSIVPVVLPPLRARREDIPALARHFLRLYSQESGRTIADFGPAAMDKLCHYSWPGNVRELRNVVERAVLLCGGTHIVASDISLGRQALTSGAEMSGCVVRLPEDGCKLVDIERNLVQQALERTNWNQTHAAKLLDLSRDQIRYKIEKYDLRPPEVPGL